MISVDHCSQFYPYAGKTIPCKGSVYRLTVLLSDKSTSIPDIIVCDNHMESYLEIGRQNSRRQYTVQKKELAGEITPSLETELPPKKELR